MVWSKNTALAFIPFVMFGLIFRIGYAGISSIAPTCGNTNTPTTTIGTQALNYSAYQITGSSAEITSLFVLPLLSTFCPLRLLSVPNIRKPQQS